MVAAGDVLVERYLLLERIGRGRLGWLWRARDQLLGRVVAAQEVQALELKSMLDRTMSEARAVARLSHPGIVAIHDIVEEGGVPWVVMQFVSGPSLEDVVSRRGRLLIRLEC